MLTRSARADIRQSTGIFLNVFRRLLAHHWRSATSRLGVVQRRIMGIETEFGVTCTFHGHRRLSPDEVARYLFRRVVSWGRSSNVFLRNGARLYLDVGSHPEYATAECDNLTQLVTHDRAGERVLEDLLIDAEQRLADEGIGGGHLPVQEQHRLRRKLLRLPRELPHRARRRVLPDLRCAAAVPGHPPTDLRCGQGVADAQGGHLLPVPASRAHLGSVSSATTRSRPIINTRDEPHADAEKYRRLHVIVGDSNMCEATTMLKVGTASLVLEMIEAGGVAFRDFSLDNPIRAIREVSHDLTGRRPVRLAGGRQASALDIQREYYARAVEYLQTREPNTQIDQVVDLWGGRQLDAVESQDFAKVDTEIDWVIKRKLFQRYQDRYSMELSDPKISQLDLAYHDIKRGRGVFDLLQRKGLATRITTDEEIEAAVDTPRRRPPGPSCAVSSSAPPRRPAAIFLPSTGCTSSSTTRPSAPCCARTRSARSTSG